MGTFCPSPSPDASDPMSDNAPIFQYPKRPAGTTPEYDEYAKALRAELHKWVNHEPPYERTDWPPQAGK